MNLEHLGQSGLKINNANKCILIDPYLSNSVQELDSFDLKREVPILYKPEELTNVEYILFTHEHIDHCDPHTVPIIAANNPKAKLIGPYLVREKLSEWNISSERIISLKNTEIDLGNGCTILSVPAAHPKLDYTSDHFPKSVGWLIKYKENLIYLSGDTKVHEKIIDFLKKMPRIDLAILPVNEDNFFRRRRGIIGNMSIREAFQLTDELEIKNLFPVHWDMFEANSALPEEIKIIYEGYKWSFQLVKNLQNLTFD